VSGGAFIVRLRGDVDGSSSCSDTAGGDGDDEDAAKIIYMLGSHLISHPPAHKKINNDGGDDLDATK
jgi:hypothetical protein